MSFLSQSVPPSAERRPRTGAIAIVPAQPRAAAWYPRLVGGMLAGDVVAVTLSLVVASFVRFGSVSQWSASTALGYVLAGLSIATVWILSLWAVKSRAKRIVGEGLTEYQRVLNATLFAFGAVAIVCYVAQIDFARGYVAVAMPLGLALLMGNRLVWRRVLLALRRDGRCLTGAMVVGAAVDVDRTVRELRGSVRAGYRPVAVSLTDRLDAAPAPVREALSSLPRVPFDGVVAATRGSRVKALMVAGDLPGGRDRIRELGWALENSRAELILVSRLTDVAGPRIHLRPVSGLPMVHVQLPQYSGFAHSLKRAFDMVAAGAGLLVLSPVFAVIALLIRFDDGGPVIFRQERVGVGGSTFTMLKFRSMVVDAEARLASLADRSEGNGVLFKMRHDPRITRVGRVLRRFSLDELPQLWNVLRGDMSLVGPRPPLPSEVESYEGHETRRLISKPGITGLWQVSGRSDLSWEESVRLDLYYVENWSFTGDLLLVMRTVVQLFRHDGAY
ncbi:sugar transferase [Microbacterium thalassium]|uniref:Exopolysaccharide biosynthesis polyprenyl glycosylphosphotransferase n=1 Tax=Microbacterium thalassium TaxID=362649 RepID=A0A7X0FMK3_9MICO|nr:sugar transferase [Microbacterium thalassium]MBB6390267.1 exopolysaccharide biosynthesis polyprenyl glycosylphosphotransferase [Microbacterium thalassium]GLK25376.1 polyprenyl glycosylphosphotransferase [Microbacterium thalassium]